MPSEGGGGWRKKAVGNLNIVRILNLHVVAVLQQNSRYLKLNLMTESNRNIFDANNSMYWYIVGTYNPM